MIDTWKQLVELLRGCLADCCLLLLVRLFLKRCALNGAIAAEQICNNVILRFGRLGPAELVYSFPKSAQVHFGSAQYLNVLLVPTVVRRTVEFASVGSTYL